MRLLKLICLTIACLCLVQYSHAQEKDGEYLWDKEFSLSVLGGPMLEFSAVDSEFGVSIGGGGALIVNRAFFIGGYGLGLSNEISRQDGNSSISLDYGHAGAWLGFMYDPSALMHFGASVKLGWGNVTLTRPNGTEVGKDNLFLVTPQLEGNVNISRWFKVSAGLGYRLSNGFDLTINGIEYNNDALSGPLGSLGFYFGWFGK